MEEQFYLIFPLILWAIYKFNVNFVFGLTVFTVISFICNKNAINHSNQTAAFYLPQFRFWELSIGAILAYIVEYHKVFVDKFKQFTKETLIKKICLRDSNIVIKDSTLNNILSIIGLLLIIIGILTVKQNLKFPGTKALIPVFGALFIIAAGKEAFINQKILSNKIMVFLGLISYPLYLWHWPLLSFAYICSGQTPEVLIRVIALGIALVLSIITFLLIEPPLRFGKHSSLKAFTLLSVLCTIGLLGFLLHNTQGIPERYNYTKESLSRQKKDNVTNSLMNQAQIRCKKVLNNFTKYAGDEGCAFQREKGKNTIALVGDSHAWRLSYGLLEELSKDKTEGLVRFSVVGRTPFVNIIRKDWKEDKADLALTEAYNYIISDKRIKTVLLINYPIAFFDIHGSDKNLINPFYKKLFKNANMKLIDVTNPNITDKSVLLENSMRKTFDILQKHNKKVIFIIDTPDFFFDPTECNSRKFNPIHSIDVSHNKCNPPRKTVENNYIRLWYNAILKKVVSDYDNIRLFNSFDSLCSDNECPIKKDGLMLYSDNNHLTIEGARLVAKDLLKFIKEGKN